MSAKTIDQALRAAASGQEPLLPPGAVVLAAVSGGPDSLCLLHALWRLREELGFDMRAAHAEHGLRGDASIGDAEFVGDFCIQHGIPLTIGSLDLSTHKRRSGESIQSIARHARYQFLEETAKKHSANCIATAHTQDDQIETVLVNILRGTGLDGLRGIPQRRSDIVRPLLTVTRADVEDYCAVHGLTPRLDGSNTDPSHYLRNRIRLELLPLLERDYHPGTRSSVARLSNLAAQDADYMAVEALATFTQLSEALTDGLQIKRRDLMTLHPAIRGRVVRLAFAAIRGDAQGIGEHHMQATLDLARQPNAGAVTSPTPACVVTVNGDYLGFRLLRDQMGTSIKSIALTVPGVAEDAQAGWRISAVIEDDPQFRNEGEEDRIEVRLDAAAIDIPTLHVRNWQPGDRIDPFGMSGRTKKIQDIFSNAKIPREDRHRRPIVCDAHGPLWIPGLVVAERCRRTDSTAIVLALRAWLPQDRIKSPPAPQSWGKS